MEFRQLGHSGGCGTFGGRRLLAGWGNTDVKEATRLVDIWLDSGVKLFDIADLYYQAASEEILGKAIAGRRNAVLVSTSSA